MPNQLPLSITGANGRMGQALAKVIAADPAVELNASFTEQLEAGNTGKVLIDFTAADATIKHVNWCVEHQLPIVIGTTGFDADQLDVIAEASTSIPIVYAPNMSVGVNILYKLLELTAKCVADDADIEIIEAHHKHKKDAPSGTALRMGEVIAASKEQQLDQVGCFARHGMTERKDNEIGFSTIRAGEIVGEHTAIFALPSERIEISHKAGNRELFAQGAVRAAKWLVDQPPGLYDMQDVLKLDKICAQL